MLLKCSQLSLLLSGNRRDDQYSEQEAARRRDATARVLLKTPPRPNWWPINVRKPRGKIEQESRPQKESPAEAGLSFGITPMMGASIFYHIATTPESPVMRTRDRDCVYGAVVIERLRAMGIRDRPISPRSPWQNGYSERLIGSIRRDCLDHVVVFGERHLRHLLNSYQKYYNEARTHHIGDAVRPVLAPQACDRQSGRHVGSVRPYAAIGWHQSLWRTKIQNFIYFVALVTAKTSPTCLT
jgi:Integrase core domain